MVSEEKGSTTLSPWATYFIFMTEDSSVCRVSGLPMFLVMLPSTVPHFHFKPQQFPVLPKDKASY